MPVAMRALDVVRAVRGRGVGHVPRVAADVVGPTPGLPRVSEDPAAPWCCGVDRRFWANGWVWYAARPRGCVLGGDEHGRGLVDQRPDDVSELFAHLVVGENAVGVEALVRSSHGDARPRSLARRPPRAPCGARPAPRRRRTRPCSRRRPPRACCEGRSSRAGAKAQSTAFLSWPGTDELYSGVAKRTASAPAIGRAHPARPPGAPARRRRPRRRAGSP